MQIESCQNDAPTAKRNATHRDKRFITFSNRGIISIKCRRLVWSPATHAVMFEYCELFQGFGIYRIPPWIELWLRFDAMAVRLPGSTIYSSYACRSGFNSLGGVGFLGISVTRCTITARFSHHLCSCSTRGSLSLAFSRSTPLKFVRR